MASGRLTGLGNSVERSVMCAGMADFQGWPDRNKHLSTVRSRFKDGRYETGPGEVGGRRAARRDAEDYLDSREAILTSY